MIMNTSIILYIYSKQNPRHVIIGSVVTKDVFVGKAVLLYFVNLLQFAHLLMDFVSHAFS